MVVVSHCDNERPDFQSSWPCGISEGFQEQFRRDGEIRCVIWVSGVFLRGFGGSLRVRGGLRVFSEAFQEVLEDYQRVSEAFLVPVFSGLEGFQVREMESERV